MIWGAQYNTSLDDDVPIYGLYAGGGFFNMSGYEPGSLIGPNFGSLLAGYRYQVAKSGLLPGYVGMTVEYGNAAENRRRNIFRRPSQRQCLLWLQDTAGPDLPGYRLERGPQRDILPQARCATGDKQSWTALVLLQPDNYGYSSPGRFSSGNVLPVLQPQAVSCLPRTPGMHHHRLRYN